MPIQDLREWIDRVDGMGELTRVRAADPGSDIGGLTDLYQWEMGKPALLFEDVIGHEPGFRLLSNVHTSISRIATTLGLPTDCRPTTLVEMLRRMLVDNKPIAAEIVENGLVLENTVVGDAVDVTRFPAPLWHPHDGGRYIGTGGIVVMRDPDSDWVNAGTYRVQVHDTRTVGLYISPGKHGDLILRKYWQRGENCPVAISLGHDPLLLLVGGSEFDMGVNEYAVAGAIRGEALPVVRAPHTGLPVPAAAEIILEGEVAPNDMRPEGPFGEWAGYYASGQRPAPVVHVTSVSYRNDPIVLGCLPGKPPNDNTYFRSPFRGALIWNELERAGVPGVEGVWSHEAGGGRLLNVVSIRQLYAGHAKQVGMAAASCHAGAYANRWVVVVDDDIDPSNTNEVIWALCTRTDVAHDVDLMRKMWSTSLDPMAYQGEGPGFFNDWS